MANFFGTPWKLDTANAAPFWNGSCRIRTITYSSATAGDKAVFQYGNPASPQPLVTLVSAGAAGAPAVWERLNASEGIMNPILQSISAGAVIVDVE